MSIAPKSYATLGEALRATRKKKGWTQAKLAGTLGFLRHAVSDWERQPCTQERRRHAAFRVLGFTASIVVYPRLEPVDLLQQDPLGHALRQARLHRGWTQAQVGDLIGLHTSQRSTIETKISKVEARIVASLFILGYQAVVLTAPILNADRPEWDKSE